MAGEGSNAILSIFLVVSGAHFLRPGRSSTATKLTSTCRFFKVLRYLSGIVYGSPLAAIILEKPTSYNNFRADGALAVAIWRFGI